MLFSFIFYFYLNVLIQLMWDVGGQALRDHVNLSI